MAGNKFDAAIIRGVTMKYKILIGEKTAEQAKKKSPTYIIRQAM